MGVTVQNPPASVGTIANGDKSGALLKSDQPGEWVNLLLSGRHYFLEISGPSQHPWVGHRLEIDEPATRALAANQVRWEAESPANTRVPDATLAGATYQIRPHITLGELFATSWEHRWHYQPNA